MMRTYEALSRPRYYRDCAGDFLIVVGVWREDGRVTRYDGAASVTIGVASQVISWEFDAAYLKRCRRVDAAAVPAVWHQSLDRYIEEVASSCAL
ncbi:hypothetical protein [Sulfobacillus harzensis]|uniref:Uncharacterized protein n=1 Tax=Sulfobacillus harzensis TaxID=2729629 RepID=A0A7Y0Q4D1_9FIRM|nr:hypothetical protein [Sulfobacillus harzensis]NMP24497.1 hypothetical protein [Sulfobacillus harzensis]